jgi:hypothetical protein
MMLPGAKVAMWANLSSQAWKRDFCARPKGIRLGPGEVNHDEFAQVCLVMESDIRPADFQEFAESEQAEEGRSKQSTQ